MGRFRGVELHELELPGERLLLRPWRPDDAQRLHAVMQDPTMGEFLALPAPYSREEAHRWVERLGDEGRRDGTGLGCAVVEMSSGRLVGSASIRLGGDEEIGFEGVGRNGLLGAGAKKVPERRADLARFARLRGDPPGRVPVAFAPLPEGRLSDGVLQLRTMQAADASAVAETDDELTLRWSFTGVAHTADEVRQLTEQAGLQWLVGRVAVFSMVDVASGRVAGSLRVRLPGPPQVGGIGYVVHPAFRGRGYATRALRLLVPWAFDQAGFARLELGGKVENAASLRAAAAAGFTPDGIRRRRLRNPDATFSDEQRYALTSPRRDP